MRAHRRAVTLVEVLIVVAVIGLLIQMLLPAVLAAREAARRANCENNLRQIGLAAQVHVQSHRQFPSGGWGYRWVGDPDRGFRRRQPGSWQYNLLPFLEEGPLRDVGQGLDESEKERALVRLVETPVPLFACPSRRPADPMPFVSTVGFANVEGVRRAGRSDYAANMGSLPPTDQAGPESLAEGDAWTFGDDEGEDVDGKSKEPFWTSSRHNGVVFQRSMVAPKHIKRGLSKTYFAGEKYLQVPNYRSGLSWGDDQCLYTGHDKDNIRSTYFLHGPRRDGSERELHTDSDTEWAYYWNFGSAHPGSLSMVMCDSSVKRVSYDVDPTVHQAQGNRMTRDPNR